jgi:undecaprenyl-diphosphatase
VLATIPVGVAGLVFEHKFRTIFAKPLYAAVFLTINGLILFSGKWYRRRTQGPSPERAVAEPGAPKPTSAIQRFRDERMVAFDDDTEEVLNRQISVWSAIWIGASQILALFAGISREGVVMVGGLFRGLSNENALRFAFLLSTPVIFAAGALKVPDLFGHLGSGIRGQVLAGSAAAVVSSLAAIAFLSRYFKHRTLVPFAVYSLVFGLVSVVRFGAF